MIRRLALLFLLVLAAPATAQTFPQLTGRVVDQANIIPDDREATLTQQLEQLQRATSRQLVVVGSIVAVVILLLVITRGSEPRYSVLYAGLSPEDAGEVVAALEARGIPHRAEAGGTAIAVPQDKVLDLRLDLAEKGLPRGGGVGFEVFDKQAFGTTSFVEQMNFRRALQGDLAAV